MKEWLKAKGMENTWFPPQRKSKEEKRYKLFKKYYARNKVQDNSMQLKNFL